MIKTTQIWEYNEYMINIRDDIGITISSKADISLTGKGRTKHEAIINLLKAIASLRQTIDEYEKVISSL